MRFVAFKMLWVHLWPHFWWFQIPSLMCILPTWCYQVFWKRYCVTACNLHFITLFTDRMPWLYRKLGRFCSSPYSYWFFHAAFNGRCDRTGFHCIAMSYGGGIGNSCTSNLPISYGMILFRDVQREASPPKSPLRLYKNCLIRNCIGTCRVRHQSRTSASLPACVTPQLQECMCRPSPI